MLQVPWALLNSEPRNEKAVFSSSDSSVPDTMPITEGFLDGWTDRWTKEQMDLLRKARHTYIYEQTWIIGRQHRVRCEKING